MNIPNILTIARFFLTALFIYYILKADFISTVVAFGVFIVASLTDYLDGFLARKYNLITGFGKLMDPIADKFLVLSAFFVFAKLGFIFWWMFIIITLREVYVTVVRLLALRQGKVLAAESLGKYKTVLQMIAVYFILLYSIFQQTSMAQNLSTQTLQAWRIVINGLMLAVVMLTVISGISFIRNLRHANHTG